MALCLHKMVHFISLENARVKQPYNICILVSERQVSLIISVRCFILYNYTVRTILIISDDLYK